MHVTSKSPPDFKLISIYRSAVAWAPPHVINSLLLRVNFSISYYFGKACIQSTFCLGSTYITDNKY